MWSRVANGHRIHGNVIQFDISHLTASPNHLGEVGDEGQCERLTNYVFCAKRGGLYVMVTDDVIKIITPTKMEGVVWVTVTPRSPTWVVDIPVIREKNIHMKNLPLPILMEDEGDDALDSDEHMPLQQQIDGGSRIWKALKTRNMVPWEADAGNALNNKSIQMADKLTQACWCRYNERQGPNFAGDLQAVCEHIAYTINTESDITLRVFSWVLFGAARCMPAHMNAVSIQLAAVISDLTTKLIGKKRYFVDDAIENAYFNIDKKKAIRVLGLRETEFSLNLQLKHQIDAITHSAKLPPLASFVSLVKDAMAGVFVSYTIPFVMGGQHRKVDLSIAVELVGIITQMSVFKWVIPRVAELLQICEMIVLVNGDGQTATIEDAAIGIWTALSVLCPTNLLKICDIFRQIEVEECEEKDAARIGGGDAVADMNADELSCSKLVLPAHHQCSPGLMIKQVALSMIATKEIKKLYQGEVERYLHMWYNECEFTKMMTGRNRMLGFRACPSHLELMGVSISAAKKVVFDVYVPLWLTKEDGYLLLLMRAIQVCTMNYPAQLIKLPLRSNKHRGCVKLEIGKP